MVSYNKIKYLNPFNPRAAANVLNWQGLGNERVNSLSTALSYSHWESTYISESEMLKAV